jgi:hypothetical protein
LISSIIQAVGLLTLSIGIGLIYIPAGITVLGISLVLTGLALERGK